MVNPYELDDCAEALHRGLTMPFDEREVRMSHLRNRERVYNVDYWMKSFLKAMGSLIEEDGEEVVPTTMAPVTMEDFDDYLSKYVGQTCKLALLLDYDGTLAPIAPHPDLAVMPAETKRVRIFTSNCIVHTIILLCISIMIMVVSSEYMTTINFNCV